MYNLVEYKISVEQFKGNWRYLGSEPNQKKIQKQRLLKVYDQYLYEVEINENLKVLVVYVIEEKLGFLDTHISSIELNN